MEMALWEKILLGVFVVVLLLWLGPGAKKSLEQSRKATSSDWKNLLIPIGLVVAFVVLLIMSV